MADQEPTAVEDKRPVQVAPKRREAAETESNGHAESTLSEGFITVVDLPRGLYDHEGHVSVRDRGRRRYHPFAYDFDSTPMSLDDPSEHWEEKVKALHLENLNKAIERLKAEYGERRHAQVIQDTKDLGAKAFSIVSYHNLMHEQARRAFVSGLYFPALVAACALGERILNHLILDLRDHYKASPHYRRVYRSESFDDWRFAVRVLEDWGVLLPDVGIAFMELATLRNRSVHFNPATYSTMREDALSALKTLGRVIQLQFGGFGRQPWFIENTPGAQFIKRTYEDVPFVKTYIVPLSGFVGVEYGMDLTERGWRHLDYHDYGPGDVDDSEYARLYRERDHSKVVTREMLERDARAQATAAADEGGGKRPSRRRRAPGIISTAIGSAAIWRFGVEPEIAAHAQRSELTLLRAMTVIGVSLFVRAAERASVPYRQPPSNATETGRTAVGPVAAMKKSRQHISRLVECCLVALLRCPPAFDEIQRIDAFHHCSRESQTLLQALAAIFIIRIVQPLSASTKKRSIVIALPHRSIISASCCWLSASA